MPDEVALRISATGGQAAAQQVRYLEASLTQMNLRLQRIAENTAPAAARGLATLEAQAARTRAGMEALGRVGTGMLVAGGAMAAGLAVSTKAAMAFDESMRNVNSIAQLSEKQFQTLRMSVLGFTSDPHIRQGPNDLAKGLYEVYSSGFTGAKAMDILKVSALGASAGLTNTATSSRVLMAVLNSGIQGVHSAKEAMDVLFQEVNLGVNNFEGLANQLGDTLPLATAAGVSLQEVAAALATLTREGINIAEANTAVVQLLTHIVRPMQESKKAMDALGISYGLGAVNAKGLSGWLQDVMEKTHGDKEAIIQLIPEVRGMKGILGLTKDEGKLFIDMLGLTGKATEGVGQTLKANSEQMKSAAFQWGILTKKLEELEIKVGTAVLPTLNKLAGVLGTLATRFSALPQPVEDATVQITALSAAVLLTGGAIAKVIAWAAGLGRTLSALVPIAASIAEALAGPLGLALAAVAAAVAALAVAWSQNWGHIQGAVANATHNISEMLKTARTTLSGIWKGLIADFRVAWAKLWSFVPQAVKDSLAEVAETLPKALRAIWDKTPVGMLTNALTAAPKSQGLKPPVQTQPFRPDQYVAAYGVTISHRLKDALDKIPLETRELMGRHATRGLHGFDSLSRATHETGDALDISALGLSPAQIKSIISAAYAAGARAVFRDWPGNRHIHIAGPGGTSNFAALPAKAAAGASVDLNAMMVARKAAASAAQKTATGRDSAADERATFLAQRRDAVTAAIADESRREIQARRDKLAEDLKGAKGDPLYVASLRKVAERDIAAIQQKAGEAAKQRHEETAAALKDERQLLLDNLEAMLKSTSSQDQQLQLLKEQLRVIEKMRAAATTPRERFEAGVRAVEIQGAIREVQRTYRGTGNVMPPDFLQGSTDSEREVIAARDRMLAANALARARAEGGPETVIAGATVGPDSEALARMQFGPSAANLERTRRFEAAPGLAALREDWARSLSFDAVARRAEQRDEITRRMGFGERFSTLTDPEQQKAVNKELKDIRGPLADLRDKVETSAQAFEMLINAMTQKKKGGVGKALGILSAFQNIASMFGGPYAPALKAGAAITSTLSDVVPFDTAEQDMRPRRWGFDFGTAFLQGHDDAVSRILGPLAKRTASAASGVRALGAMQVTVNNYGAINNGMDAEQLGTAAASMFRRTLATA